MESTKKEILRDDVFYGVLSHFKIVPVDDKTKGAEVLDKAYTKKLIALNIRKVAFTRKDLCIGQDLFYDIKRNTPYEYNLILPTYNLSCESVFNNTLVIRNVQTIGALLWYTGFDKQLEKEDLQKIKQMLMCKNDMLDIEPHGVKLGLDGIIGMVPENIGLINEQAAALRDFRSLCLPTAPQRKEKVYAKYFK